jgi:serine/threonine protein kinase
MSDERGTSDDSTRFAAGRGADDETRFTGVGAPPPGGGPSHTTFPPGSLIGHTYRIEALLARGGMGEVYRARHAELDTDHALKIILPELANNQRIVDLFRREASVLRTIRHDAVVAYDGVFRDENGRLYLVMEFADGPSLSKLMRERPFSAEEVRVLRDRLADGLAVAHEKGVIHRDISPDNVILPGGDVAKAKIIDFGISKMADPEQKTIVGEDFAGKFSYVSPEQLGMFGGKVDGRSDIYSLGLVLAAAAQGEPLDMGLSPISVIEARRAVPDLSRVPAAVRADLAAMLQPDPADRPQSMREVARPQEQRGGRRSTLSDTSRPSAKSGAGRMAAIAGALAVLVVAGGAAGYWYWQNRGTRDGTTETAQQSGTAGDSAQDTVTGATASQQQQGVATGTTTADSVQAGSNAATVTANGDESTAATQSTTTSSTADGAQSESQSQQTNDSAATATNQATAATSGDTTPEQQQVTDASQSTANSAANDQQSSTTAATTGAGGPSETTTPTEGATSSTQVTGAAASNTNTDAPVSGAVATGTQTALLPQAPDVVRLRSEAQDAVGSLGCAGVAVAVSERGDIVTSGYVASETDRTKLFATLKALPQVGRVDNTVAVMTPPLCQALDVLREETAYNVAAAPRIDPGGEGGVYYASDKQVTLTVSVTAMSDGYLYVDYVDAKNDPSYKPTDPKELDQYVLHLLPNDRWRKEERYVKAGERVIIGDRQEELDHYTIEPPFGTYVIIAVVSPERLFEHPRAIQEPAAIYLPALRARLASVAERVGREKLPAASTTITFREKR